MGVLYLLSSLVAQRIKHVPAMRETQVQSLGWEDPLEKETATHSSILAWRIPWREEPVGLQSTGSQSRTRLSEFTSLVFIRQLYPEVNLRLSGDICGRHNWTGEFWHLVEVKEADKYSTVYHPQKDLSSVVLGWKDLG